MLRCLANTQRFPLLWHDPDGFIEPFDEHLHLAVDHVVMLACMHLVFLHSVFHLHADPCHLSVLYGRETPLLPVSVVEGLFLVVKELFL